MANKKSANTNKLPDTSPPKARKPRKAAEPKTVLKDAVLWVISRRTRMFLWEPFQVFPTEAQAREFLEFFESTSKYSGRGYKLNRVDLITQSLEEVLTSLETP